MAKMGMAKVVLRLMVCATLLVVYANAVDSSAASSGFPVPSYFVMGDAYHDAGNNNFIKTGVQHANYKPYGMTFFPKPTGRFCDGRIFPDFLAAPVKLPLAPPSERPSLTIAQKGQCVNYASGGSAILPSSSVAWGAPNARTFEQQMTKYEGHAVDVIYEFGIDEALLILNDAIYQLNFGTIDILAYFTKSAYATTIGPIQKFLETLAKEYRIMINRLYSRGARKVVVFGVGPIHKSPFGQLFASKMKPRDGRKWSANVDSAVQQLNGKLKLMVTQLNADNGLDQEHASLQLVFADVYGAVMDITKKPYKYGFDNVKKACCGAGKFGAEVLCGLTGSKTCKCVSKNLYWNYMQFTEAGNKQLFQLFFNGTSFVTPMSVRELAMMLIPGVPY